MKNTLIILCVVIAATMTSFAENERPYEISDLSVKGRIEDENISFKLAFTVNVLERGARIPLVSGDVAHLASSFPRKSELSRAGSTYYVTIPSRGEYDIEFEFAGRAIKNELWLNTNFKIPSASIRQLSVVCDRDDLEVLFPGALNVERARNKENKTEITAFLGISEMFVVQWKPYVKKLAADLVLACDANTVALASVGALKLDNVFSYQVVQGALKEMSFALPKNINITQVRGEDIQDWLIEDDNGDRVLKVTLSRAREDVYLLQVESEMVLPNFPARMDLPVVTPRNVIRSSGFLMTGTDSAIKVLVDKAFGLTQIDQSSFPSIALTVGKSKIARPLPSRSKFAYQFANTPYTLAVSVDDIVSEYSASERLVLSMQDNDLVFSGSIELDVRDAPVRELAIETSPDWIVANVSGKALSDYDIRDSGGKRVIHLFFREAVLGATLLDIRLEKSLADKQTAFEAPSFKLLHSKSVRGYIVIAAEKGVRIKSDQFSGLREVLTGSVETRVAGAQHAYRFKEDDWTLNVGVERTEATIHSEMFHLVSIGEGVLYCSAVVTYHIEGAPVRYLKLQIPAEFQNVEFTGRDVRGWEHAGDIWAVALQEKVIGDYTLGFTYDKHYEYKGDVINVGSVQTVGTSSEAGYIVLASSANLNLKLQQSDDAIIKIDHEEIPKAYNLLVNDPILESGAYKYVMNPHQARIQIERLETERLLDQVADHTDIRTTISKDGEAVTTIVYSLKNLSKQYFAVNIPEKANLWSTRQFDENDSVGKAVVSLQEGNRILIPIPRLQNPNLPVRVEITYAESKGELGKAGRKLEFFAPVTEETHSTFTKWTLTAPSDYAVVMAGGNMTTDIMSSERGIIRLIKKLLKYDLSLDHEPNSIAITRTVDMASKSPLSVIAQVKSSKLGASSSVPLMIMFMLGGLALLTKKKGNRRMMIALGLTLITIGLAEINVTRQILLVIFALGLPIAILTKIVRFLGRIAKERKQCRKNKAADEELPAPFEPIPHGDSASSGSVKTSLLLLVSVLMIAFSVVAKPVVDNAPLIPALPTVESLQISIDAPAMKDDVEKSALVNMAMKLSFDKAGEYMLLSSPAVLRNYKLSSRYLKIVSGKDGYMLLVEEDGEYEVNLDYSVPIKEANGVWGILMEVPANLGNKIDFRIPEVELDITSPEAVLKKKTESREKTDVHLVYGSSSQVNITWQARARKTKLEKVVFSSEVNSIATFKPGVVEINNHIIYRIAQGELKSMSILVPASMSVTAVKAPGLSTWRFDPETHMLEAILEKPVSGNFSLYVGSQISCEGLPYTAKLGALEIKGTSRQRGSLGLAVPETVQIMVDASEGLNLMNIEDIAPESMKMLEEKGLRERIPVIKRAFRYHNVPMEAVVKAEQVLPEIRIFEDSSLSVSDERIVLSTRITPTVTKAGIFSLKLGIPAGYDVETLTGQDVSHWDELLEEEQAVVVHFTKQITGSLSINLVVARTEKGVEDTLSVPRITVGNALKHTGRIIVSGERGIRMTTIAREGVSEVNPRDLDIRQTGVLAYTILRPDWQISLKADVVEPTVRSEVLQRVDLSEGMLQCTAFIQYRIDHAGLKTFIIQSPEPGLSLTVTGDNIAKVHETDKEKGLWEVELRNKVENKYSMTVRYQVAENSGKKIMQIKSLKTVDAVSQKGYLVVLSGGRIQVKPIGGMPGLKIDNARSIPAYFGAGDLSDAIYCYRTISGEYELTMSVVRHGSADVLPASIEQVTMTSVVAADNEMLTEVEVSMTVGKLPHLLVSMPDSDTQLWTVFVDGKATTVSRTGNNYRIPLGDPVQGETTSVKFVYASHERQSLFSRTHKFAGPKFNLPLNNIEWNFYVVPGREYYAFDGSMEHQQDISVFSVFDSRSYAQNNQELMAWNRNKAKSGMAESEEFAKTGNQRRAKRALQSALNYAQNDTDAAFNEDARIQYKNLAEQQAVVGLVQRRDEMRYNMNKVESGQMQRIEEFNAGNFTADYANKVQEELDDRDNVSLIQMAGKILDQQVAAERVSQAINIAMPTHGELLQFKRSIQIAPDADMTVTFKSRSQGGGIVMLLLSAVVLFAIYRFVFLPVSGASRRTV